jgi:hypothetical protein
VSTISNTAFLEALFADALPGTYTVVCSFAGDPYKVDRPEWAGRPWSPGQRLAPRFDGGNTYTTVSMFEPDPQSGEMRRRKALFTALHAVMIDDIGTKVGRAKLLLAPSAMIETSPQNFQAYLFVRQDEHARDRGMCERLIERMVAAGLTADGKDPGMKGVTRYGRLPVGVNGKAKYVQALGRPFQTRCTTFEPQRRYSITEIADAWRLDLTAPKPAYTNVVSITPALARKAGEQFGALLETLQLMQMYRGKIGAGPWHAITCPWIDSHTDRAETGSAIAEPSADNNFAGGYRCFHGHCDQRSMRDVRRWLRELVRLLDERKVQ